MSCEYVSCSECPNPCFPNDLNLTMDLRSPIPAVAVVSPPTDEKKPWYAVSD